MKIEQFIKELRNSDEYIHHIYTNGGCYKFHILLSKMYKNTIPYISCDKNHIITKYRGKYYDIHGERNNIGYTPLTENELSLVNKWSFHRHNLLLLKDCPHCDEPIIIENL